MSAAATSVRLAFLGDIHGNLPALEAVMADLDKERPDAVYLLGDLVNRCPWTSEVMDRLAEADWPSIQGNHDLILSVLNTPLARPPFDVPKRFPLIQWTWEQLRPEQIQRLGNLPKEMTVEMGDAPPLRLFHGVPGNPFVGILPEDSDESIRAHLRSCDAPIIVCGHTHRPMDRTLSTTGPGPQKRQRVLNCGSVGLPYNGDPRAHYMLLDLVQTSTGKQWQSMIRRVDYDRQTVADAYRQVGLLAVGGPLAQLYLRTVMDGQPWASDFGFWLKHQPDSLRQRPQEAVKRYLTNHGPHHWAFFNYSET